MSNKLNLKNNKEVAILYNATSNEVMKVPKKHKYITPWITRGFRDISREVEFFMI